MLQPLKSVVSDHRTNHFTYVYDGFKRDVCVNLERERERERKRESNEIKRSFY